MNRNPIRRICAIALLALSVAGAHAELTLDSCLAMAERHYPTIRKFGIVEKISDISLSDINKSWLPQATVYVQGTVQNAVPQFPDALRAVLSQMGQKFEGLGKEQYKIGLDITQTIWDGGSAKARRESSRAMLAEQQAALGVEMYGVRERLQTIFFGILLTQEQTAQLKSTMALLESNLEQMRAMKRNGVAMQCDVDMIEAQKLTLAQQLASTEGYDAQLRCLLEVFTGQPTAGEHLVPPGAVMPSDLSSNRPELHLFQAQQKSNDSRLSAIKASLMPRIGFFAQVYYGYPGFDYFSAMKSRDLSFNAMAGVKLSWNIASAYTRKNDIRKIALSNESIDADREKFEFESKLATTRQLSDIRTMQKVTAEDRRIIELRANVRQAAESQLKNGVIDATALLSKITDEQQARLTASYHDVELLRLIYQLKNTLNR